MENPTDKDTTNNCDGGSAQRVDIGGSSFTSGGFGKYSRGLPDGGARIPNFGGGYPGIRSGTYSSSSGGGSICCIGIVILIILGLILNFIFHIELWLIAVILVIVFIVGVIALVILD